MADLEERIRAFLKSIPQKEEESESSCGGGMAECGGGDTFAERAEWFFEKRPELLNLLQELYSGYISLKESKHQRRHSSSLTLTSYDQQQQQEEIDTNWDIESSLSNSYHQNEDHGKTLFRTGSWSAYPDIIYSSGKTKSIGLDEFVSHLVMKNVEEEIIKGQMGEMEQQNQECVRKMEILKKLIEVLESERVVLLSENSRLGYKVAELMEENQGLVSEAMFLKRKAAQLGRCVMKMKEDHRVYMLTRKIEDLQTQIHGLEKRNYEQKKEEEEAAAAAAGGGSGLMGCFQSAIKKRNEGGEEGKKRGRKWWEKVKKGMNFPGFGIHGFSSSYST